MKAEVLWQDPHDGGSGADDSASAIAASSERRYVAGHPNDPHSSTRFTVRSYNARIGNLLWQDISAAGKAVDIAVNRGRVLVAGHRAATQPGGAFLLWAYNARQGRRVVLVGTVLDEEEKWNFSVRVYHAATGRLLWEKMHDDTRNDDKDTAFARAVAMHGDRLFAAGTLADNFEVRGFGYQVGCIIVGEWI